MEDLTSEQNELTYCESHRKPEEEILTLVSARRTKDDI